MAKSTDLRQAMLNQSRGAAPTPEPQDPVASDSQPGTGRHHRPGRRARAT